jgi:hypothetical protein
LPAAIFLRMGNFPIRGFRNQNAGAVAFGQALQARGEIDGVTDNGCR